MDYVIDVHSREERKFYDKTYESGGWATQESLDTVDFLKLWRLESGSNALLASLGDVRGKHILLLGNGTSVKEFLLVARGAHVVFTDLSNVAMDKMRERYDESTGPWAGSAKFDGVNAYDIPYADASFDIVCADAVVHHLDDLECLFAGIARVLKPNGICRFADTAYSPLWQAAKGGILKSLQKRVHARQGISPEDVKATERGGYTLEELQALTRVGFYSVHYERVALLDYLLWRTRCKLEQPWVLAFRPLARALDKLLAMTPIMYRHGISLVFGFDKSNEALWRKL